MRMISASNPANTKAARSTQANDHMIKGGGSCGNISDSVSMLPRLPDKMFTRGWGLDSELLAGQVVIKTALSHQFVVSSHFRDAAFLEHDDGMRFADGAEA